MFWLRYAIQLLGAILILTFVVSSSVSRSAIGEKGFVTAEWERRGLALPVRFEPAEGRALDLFELIEFGEVDDFSHKAQRQSLDDLHLLDEFDRSFLEIAAIHDRRDFVNFFLDRDLKSASGDVFVPLIKRDQFQLIEKLAKRGVDPNMELRNGSTPLVAAINWGSADTVAVLIQSGATNHQSVDGLTPSQHADRQLNLGRFPDPEHQYKRIAEELDKE